MSQKNETTVLVLAIIITASLVGAGFWWFTSRSGFNTGSSLNNQSNQSAQSDIETFAQVKQVPKGLFNYGGSKNWAPIRGEVDPAIKTVWPQFRLRYTDPNNTSPSSDAGIRMLLDNQLSFAQSSRPLKDKEYEQATQRGFKLKEIPVAIDAIAIAVHPSLNITGLTIKQYNDIYSNKITNWNQIGGPDLKITVYVVEGETLHPYVQMMPTPTEALRKLSADPGGIYQASASLLVPQCKIKTLPLAKNTNEMIAPYQEPFVPLEECPKKRNQVNIPAFQTGKYPLTRRLLLVVKQNGEIDQQAGETYANLLLTEQGQEMIEKAGFVRIR